MGYCQCFFSTFRIFLGRSIKASKQGNRCGFGVLCSLSLEDIATPLSSILSNGFWSSVSQPSLRLSSNSLSICALPYPHPICSRVKWKFAECHKQLVINLLNVAISPYWAGNAPPRHRDAFGYGDIDSFRNGLQRPIRPQIINQLKSTTYANAVE